MDHLIHVDSSSPNLYLPFHLPPFDAFCSAGIAADALDADSDDAESIAIPAPASRILF